MDGIERFAYFLDYGIGMLAENKEVDEVHHELAENDGELVPRHERAAKVARCHLGYVHGAYRRGKADAHTTDDAIDIECHQQIERRLAIGEEEKFRIIRTKSRHKEQHSGADKGRLAAQTGGEPTRQGASENTAEQGAARRDAVYGIGVHEVGGAEEKGLQAFFRTGNHRCVIPEEQSAEYGHCHYREQV